jgi:HAD-superfamily hydrolase, subfamily IIB
MIKVIVSDLDGTLLRKGKQELEDGTIELIEACIDKGILFVAASGRQYPNMERLFYPIKDKMAFICENGSLVVYKDEVIEKSSFEDILGKEIIQAIMKRQGCELLLSGAAVSYLQPKDETFAYRMQHIVKNNVQLVDNIMTVKDAYLKISVYEKDGIDNSADYWVKKFADRATVVTSGVAWLDILPLGVNKGSALEILRKRLKFSYDTAMAFGDQNNDIEMLRQVKYGYAMKHATEEAKRACQYNTATVEEVLKEVLEGAYD